MLHYAPSRGDEDLKMILSLQYNNLESNITAEELSDQGFVTVHHNLELLRNIAGPYGHMLAKDQQRLVGYALLMLKEYGNDIAVLKPMFDIINQMSYGEQLLADVPYVVMGQVCIDKMYRGTGVFHQLYLAMQAEYAKTFTYLITEVAIRNQRSIRAHAKIGFDSIKTYEAEGEVWEILLWDWQK